MSFSLSSGFNHICIIFILSAEIDKISYSGMWLGRQHIYFISDYATVFPNVKVLLLFENTSEQFSSTVENFHVKPKLPFPYASISLYFIIISVSCCQYKKDRHNIYTKHVFLFQSTDAVPLLFC